MINGRNIAFAKEKTTLGETEDGKSFLELRIHKLINYPPLFSQPDVSASYEIGPVTYTPPPKPSINEIRITTYADGMISRDRSENIHDRTGRRGL